MRIIGLGRNFFFENEWDERVFARRVIQHDMLGRPFMLGLI
jgi:hypothetical protein